MPSFMELISKLHDIRLQTDREDIKEISEILLDLIENHIGQSPPMPRSSAEDDGEVAQVSEPNREDGVKKSDKSFVERWTKVIKESDLDG